MAPELEKRIQSIEERNRRVEANKAWETSFTRISIIAVSTYIFAVVFLYAIDAPKIYLSALVPTVGFILSTRSISFVKQRWIRKKV